MRNEPAEKTDQAVPPDGVPEPEENPSRLRQMLADISLFKIWIFAPAVAVIEGRLFGSIWSVASVVIVLSVVVRWCRPKRIPHTGPTLGLGGDLDDVELLMDIEQAFNVDFSDRECEGLVTVGDIYRLILEHLPKGEERGTRFAQVMAFYRLRAALQPLWPDEPLRPGTSLARCKEMDVQEIYRPITEQTGLKTPRSVRSEAGEKIANTAWAVAALIIVQGIYFGLPWWGIVLALIIVFIAASRLLSRTSRRLPPQFDTFGTLATWIAHQNSATLMNHGARMTEQDAWAVLCHIIEEHTLLKPAEVTPEMTIYA